MSRFLAILLLVLGPGSAAAEGINLSWGDCGTHGSEIRTFACATNSGVDEAFASFVPPAGFELLLAIESEILIESAMDLPDWWKHGSQLCRGSAGLTSSFDFTSGPSSCGDPWVGQAVGGNGYEVGYGGPNRARLRTVAALPAGNEQPVVPGVEYYALRVRVSHSRSTGSGSCAGCNVPVRLTLNSIRLDPPGGQGPVLTTPISGNVIHWQNTFGPLPVLHSVSPAAGPVGTPVTITGIRLGTATSVKFHTVEAAFTVVSDTEISTSVPAGGRTGLIHVQSPDGIGSSGAPFVVAPEIASFAPTRGPVGTTVILDGINFTATTAVEFNGVSAVFSVDSDTRLLAVVPPGSTDGPIAVFNAGGSDVTDDIFEVGPVPIPGDGAINLSWDDCGTAGTEFKTFACATNSGSSFPMIASFGAPENIVEFNGMQATLEITTAAPALPDWWKHGSGQCRGAGGLGTTFDFTSGPFSCLDPWNGQAVGGHVYEVGFGGPERARLRIVAAVPPDFGGPLTAGSQYYAFRVNLLRSKTTGTGSCAGCAVPACITLQQIQLMQDAGQGYDPVITFPGDRNYVRWQSDVGIPACPASNPPPPLDVALTAAPRLSIDRVIAAGSGREISLAMTLLSDEETRVEVFDARGRRLASQAFGGLSAGKQQVTLRRSAPLASGIYFARVIQGSRTAARTFSVTN